MKFYPAIKNPGPNTKKELSVYYQNVQSLIPFGYLGNEHPVFNDVKIFELHHYVETHSPDIVILNETWLKESILDSEIFPQDMYRIFRHDRCTETHPIDLSNPKKFRKNGGGVLIAVSNQLSIQSNVIPLKHEAEMLAIEIILKNKTKIIIATCYRVGTLGTRNADEILKALRMLSRKKSVKKFIMVGDFNLPQINWVSGTGTSTLDNIFLNGFAESGMVQCIQESTHKKGSTLDILLSRSSEHIKNLNIVSDKSYLNSDHYLITFDIMIKCKRRTLEKRSVYNYSRADWPNMLLKLSDVNWEMVLDKLEPDIAWETFKKLLFSIIDKHVPKIKVKKEFRSPWFDSECLQNLKKKKNCIKSLRITVILNLKVNAKILAWLLREAFNISLNIVISSKIK